MAQLNVALFGYLPSEITIKALAGIIEAIDVVGGKASIEKSFKESVVLFRETSLNALLAPLDTFSNQEEVHSETSLFVSFGGDGTMLKAITYIKDSGIPLVGVNTGRLGFLSTIDVAAVQKVITDFVAGQYTIEERTMVGLYSDTSIKAFEEVSVALNEITVSRKDTTAMITVATYLDGEYLTSYWADGLIIATPTGSTGYSLSCGGPVMAPGTNSLILTPIAPHNLNARPLIIADHTEIRLVVSGREPQHLVSLDSRIASIDNGTELLIKKAPYTLKMVAYSSESFLKTLRKKLLWGEDKRN
ncbi:NAD kinase [Flavobacteriaceae bacterium]|nr:NAD kinase [Flavobacteriaceae bacterium]MDB4768169.1 NAD kinase [Flavobacteriaceae bacterium]